MAWLGIQWMNQYTLSRCTSIEQAYFVGASICIKPITYCKMISYYTTKHNVVIANESNGAFVVIVYFGSSQISFPDAIYLSITDLQIEEFFMNRKERVRDLQTLELL